MDIREAPLVTTIKERCRLCYTCVRECPSKAIRITSGQAEVLANRCIGCGNCVRVCSQNAKAVVSGTEDAYRLIRSDARVAALVAPSFPAQFAEVEYEYFVSMLRALGFDLVTEVAFGADLVAREYRKLLAENRGQRFIATTCPAIIGFVERYHPELVPALAPIVSPMIATARGLRRIYGTDLKVVFIGPCIAKKGEASSTCVAGEIDAVLTFAELSEMFQHAAIKPESVTPSDFDPPHGGFGTLFPISRGMLQAARITEDLLSGNVVAADGRSEFVEALKEFGGGDLQVRLLEVLSCNGCIMGPGVTNPAPLFNRRALVTRYAQQRMASFDRRDWQHYASQLRDLNLRRDFTAHDQRVAVPSEDEVAEILGRLGKATPGDELNCGACGYETCREHAIAIYKGLAENEMCLPYTIEQLKKTCSDLAKSHKRLASTQEALMQSEKLASMGQLAAGIAHEVNNPLGTVLMLSHTLMDELGPSSPQHEDLQLMASEADRCRKIVSGLLQFARKNKVEVRSTSIRTLMERTVRTLRLPERIQVRYAHERDDLRAELDADQIAQVLINLINNAVDAMPDGGTLTMGSRLKNSDVELEVSDTGVGIPPDVCQKVFEPFFTTKGAGKGTGLGLSVTYGIVKMHHGDIRVKSNSDPQAGPTGTTFTVRLPRQKRLPIEPESTAG